MGVLDDAIREHLDLKRRRGADPAEIERAEREALGPVRRNRDPALEDPDAVVNGDHAPADFADDEPDDGIAVDLVDEPDPADERHSSPGGPFADGSPFADESPFADDELPPGDRGAAVTDDSDPETAEHVPLVEPRAAAPETPAAEDPLEDDQPFADDDEPRTQVMRTADVAGLGDQTAEYDVEGALDGEGHEPEMDLEDDDVLEETPEFLQDTPDHDRLWFEQRPPRDFDFDG